MVELTSFSIEDVTHRYGAVLRHARVLNIRWGKSMDYSASVESTETISNWLLKTLLPIAEVGTLDPSSVITS